MYKRLSTNNIILVAFLLGVVGFEVFAQINNISGLRKFINKLFQIKKILDSGINIDDIKVEDTETSEENNNENKEKEKDEGE